jgi:hypothetical protein
MCIQPGQSWPQISARGLLCRGLHGAASAEQKRAIVHKRDGVLSPTMIGQRVDFCAALLRQLRFRSQALANHLGIELCLRSHAHHEFVPRPIGSRPEVFDLRGA